eukprot:COSAG02_NODE_13035_length_1456_cov_17.156964_2_plen_350_part_00
MVEAGSVYFTSVHTGWRVFALDAATGIARWNFTTPDTSSATQPAVFGSGVFFAALRGKQVRLVNIDADTGAVIWDVHVPGIRGVAAPPTVADSTLYITLDTGLHAFNAATGAAIWAQTALTACSNTVPVVDTTASIVYAARGKSKNGVIALDARTGQPRWTALPQVDNPWASPVLADGQVFIGGFESNAALPGGGYYTGLVYALSAESGSLQWQRNLTHSGGGTSYAPILSQTTANGTDGVGRVFVAGAMSAIFALDVMTGVVSWRGPTGTCGHLWMTPYVDGKTVYAGCDNGALFAFGVTSGEQQWVYRGSPGWAARSPVVADGRVFVGFNGQRGAATVPDKIIVFSQ